MREEKGDTYFNKLNRISFGWNLVLLAVMLLFAVLVLAPLILVVIISFSSADSIATIGYSFKPSSWTLIAYENLLGKGLGKQILDSYIVTILYTVVGTTLSLLVMSLYAYVLAQRNFACKKLYTFILFFTMLFGGGLVPSYIINTQYLHLYDSFLIFILPGLVGGYNVIILRTFVQTTIPDSLFDAAKIDGAGHFTVYGKIVMPLFKAGLATIGLFCVVGKWNDWFTGMLYIENPKLVPLQTMLTRIQTNINFIKENSALKNSAQGAQMLKDLPSESTRMAIVIISTIPILFAYPFFQRYFVEGITIGSVKG